MDDAELEQAMRDGLERRAALADDTVPLADRAQTDVRRRRRGGRLVAGLVAASVAVVAVVGVALHDDQRSDPSVGVTDEPDVPTGEPGWRTEYWADIAVDVPDDWGFGVTPDRGGAVCGGGAAMFDASGERVVSGGVVAAVSDLPYVGRPIIQSDACFTAPGLSRPPFVWLGSEREPGIVQSDDGTVQETVELGGSRVTVSTGDADLRRRILASVRHGDLCAGELVGAPQPGPMLFEGIDEPVAATVCVYRQVRDRISLVHAVRLDAAQTGALVGAVSNGRPPEVDRDCASGLIWVTLDVEGVATDDRPVGAGGEERWVVDLLCSVLQRDSQTLELTPAMVRPWSGGGTAIALGSFGLGASVLDSVLMD